ncbi:TlpA family protein disulfide reductase [Paraflavitalea pollutisoli]|uniref:TlpA family protein disulfide reductase n=1 Tax=Paraflavitalea pollutisoli TaxID=3034143 RepID=UPI0023EE2909|nr:TlpA disulfide reductase family protein [Paraflavitalea sp. H1-2-19X]
MKYWIIWALVIGSAGQCFAQKPTYITGTIDHFDKDSVVVSVLEDAVIRQMQVLKVAVTQGRFQARATISKSCLISISDGEFYVNGMVDAGDSLVIHFDAAAPRSSVRAEGRGREAFGLMNGLTNNTISAAINAAVPQAKTTPSPLDYLHRLVDSAQQHYLQQLALIKPILRREAAQLLEGEIKGALLYKRYNLVGPVYNETAIQAASRQEQISPAVLLYLLNPMQFDGAFAESGTYINNVRSLINMHYDALVMAGKRSNSRADKYRYADSVLPVSLRQPVLTLFLLGDIREDLSREEFVVLEQLVFRQKDVARYRDFVVGKYDAGKAMQDGMPAPDFLVEDEKGQPVRLADLKGKTVYVDFWFGACGPCHVLFKDIAPVKKHFKDNDKVIFLTVSVDNNVTWKKAIKQFGVEGYHVFTQDQERAHPMIRDYRVDGYPTTLVIGPDGKIAVTRPARTADALIAQLNSVLMP